MPDSAEQPPEQNPEPKPKTQKSFLLGSPIPYTPDPAELARRIEADKLINELLSRIAELEELARQRSADYLAETRPLREDNQRLVKQRKALLVTIRRNDAKIRTITERSKKQDNDVIKMRRHLSLRKEQIKERYVKQLIVKAREQLNKTLPINPVLAKPATPEPPTDPQE